MSTDKYSSKSQFTTSSSTRRMSSLSAFMEVYRVKDKNGPHTHLAYGYDHGVKTGKYNIPFDQRKEFSKLAAKAAFSSKASERIPFFIVERMETYGPLRIDFDFKYTVDDNAMNGDVPPRFYTPTFLTKLITYLSTAIHQNLQVPFDDLEKRLMFVFEKEGPSEAQKSDDGTVLLWKDGLHLMMPRIITTCAVQRLIRAEMLDLLGPLCEQYKSNGVTPMNSAEDMYDESILKHCGWPVWGSVKPHGKRYSLTSIWSTGKKVEAYGESEIGACSDDNVTIQNQLNMIEEGHVFSPNENKRTAECLVQYLTIQGYDVNDNQELTNLAQTEVKKLQDAERERAIQKKQHAAGPQFVVKTHDDLLEVLKYVDLIDARRADSYTEWFELGCCLHNLHNVDDTLLDWWIQFSQKSDKYTDAESEAACRTKWNGMRDSGFGLGTLKMWALNDNPTGYKALAFESMRALVKECCNKVLPAPKPSEGDDKKPKEPKARQWPDIVWYVCKVLRKLYEQEFVCASWQHKLWYRFAQHRWREEEMGILGMLSEEVSDFFMQRASWYTEQRSNLEKDADVMRANYDRWSRACYHISNELKNPTRKEMAAKEAAEKFYWQHHSFKDILIHSTPFEEVLDRNLYLIGMENGIYDLEHHVHRPGRCEDYVSKTTGNMYHSFTWNDPQVQAVMAFVKQVLPNAEEREYVLTLLASFCDGEIQELFHIFVGSGGNGKSKLIELYQKAMGEKYCGQLPITALTGKRTASSAATPEFARLKGMRFVVLQEPDQKEKLQAGLLKELTGGDTIYARALHKEPIEFKPQFGLVMASNVLPEVPGDDGGVWRRMRVVRFNSRFVNEDKVNESEHMYPIDVHLTKKLDEWKEAFFWVMMQYYKVYRLGDAEKDILHYDEDMCALFPNSGPKLGLRPSPCIQIETKKYKARCNRIGDFIDSNINKNQPITCGVRLNDLWLRYAAQCRQDGIQANKEELRDAMELRFNEMKKEEGGFAGWRGVSIRMESQSANNASN